MQYVTKENARVRPSCSIWQCRVIRIIMVPLALCIGISFFPEAQAEGNWDVEGANGVLYVEGMLTESACRLDMSSTWQEISLGTMDTAKFQHVGDQGTPVSVRLNLEDCLPNESHAVDSHNGNVIWSPDQPAVSVRFIAPADEDNPQLVQVKGVSGLALRLTDSLGRDVRLGSHGAPLLLVPGLNQVIYTITPERTRAPLRPGAYQAQINFGLSYD